jgi:hypothetical protein
MMADQEVHERQRPFAVLLAEPSREEDLRGRVDSNVVP